MRDSTAAVSVGRTVMAISPRGIMATADGAGDAKAMLWIPVRIKSGRSAKR